MIILLDTSTPICKLRLVEDSVDVSVEWGAGRTLAKGLLGYITSNLADAGKKPSDVSGLVAYEGPGSFTGLRIGLTVLNTFADSEQIPIVGTTGDDWQAMGLARLQARENDKLVMPAYGAEAHITTPRK